MFIDELESEGKLKVAVLQDRYETWIEEENFRLVIAEAVASGVEDLEYNGGALLLHRCPIATDALDLQVVALSGFQPLFRCVSGRFSTDSCFLKGLH